MTKAILKVSEGVDSEGVTLSEPFNFTMFSLWAEGCALTPWNWKIQVEGNAPLITASEQQKSKILTFSSNPSAAR